MTSERLLELRRQRDAVQTHLAWLDAEITRETTASPAPTMPPSLPLTAGPESTIAAYEPNPVAAAAAARQGCLIGAVTLTLLGLALLIALYFWRYRDHPLLFTPAHNRTATTTHP